MLISILCAHLLAAKAVTHCTTAGDHGIRYEDETGATHIAVAGSAGAVALLLQKTPSLTGSSYVGVAAYAPAAPRLAWWIETTDLICKTSADLKLAQADLQRERSNPAGVVDLVVLHDDGQAIQSDRAVIAESLTTYRKTTGLAFNPATMCSK